MDFTPNVSPVEVIKKGAFGGTYFRDIYSAVNEKCYKNSWKEFNELESIDKKYYSTRRRMWNIIMILGEKGLD